MNEAISSEEWDFLMQACLRDPDVCEWAKQFLQDAARQSGICGEINGIRYTTEKVSIQRDYLEFLEQQIDLNARGDKWSAVLEERRQRLISWIGRELIHFFAIRDGQTLSVYFDSKQGELVHMEAH